ncbi:hypothetical protein [Devosia sp.]|uniref:hypothetical protein n=1 Tax=Devosia sp. TaxID=1871048 RepID=UPI0032652F55
MRRQIIPLLGCFVAGATIGSLAPLVATLGANSVLFRLVVETWRSALFVHGWWPWPIATGALFALGYWGLARLKR